MWIVVWPASSTMRFSPRGTDSASAVLHDTFAIVQLAEETHPCVNAAMKGSSPMAVSTIKGTSGILPPWQI